MFRIQPVDPVWLSYKFSKKKLRCITTPNAFASTNPYHHRHSINDINHFEIRNCPFVLGSACCRESPACTNPQNGPRD